MKEDLQFDGKKYISSRRAAQSCGYTQDYIGQLIRSKKIDTRMVGRAWFVSEESVMEYKALADSLQGGKTLFSKSAHVTLPVVEKIEAKPRFTYLADERPLLPEIKKPEPVVVVEAVPEKVIRPVSRKISIPSKALVSEFRSKVLAGFVSLSLITGSFWMSDVEHTRAAYKNIQAAGEYVQGVLDDSYATVSGAVGKVASTFGSLLQNIKTGNLASVATMYAVKKNDAETSSQNNSGSSVTKSAVTTSEPLTVTNITNISGVTSAEVSTLIAAVREDLQFQIKGIKTAGAITTQNVRNAREAPLTKIINDSTINDSVIRNASIVRATDLSVIGESGLTALTFINATGTNATTSNFYTDNLTALNITFTSSSVTNSTTSNATTTNLYTDLLTANNAIVSNFTSYASPIAPYFTATSTNATSTFAGGLIVNGVGIGTTTGAATFSLFRDSGNIAVSNFYNTFNSQAVATSSGGGQFRPHYFSATATGTLSFQDVTNLTLDVANRIANGTTSMAAISSNLRISGTSNSDVAYGYRVIPILSTTGRVDNYIGFEARTPSITSGTLASAYGLYLQSQSTAGVTNGYGVYQAGSSDKNYFAGNVGIGTTTPFAKLSISSFNNGSSSLFAIGTSTGSGATSTAFIVDAYGSVGINTSNPNPTNFGGGVLAFRGVNTSQTGTIGLIGNNVVGSNPIGRIAFLQETSGSTANIAFIQANRANSSDTSGDLTFLTSDTGALTEKMRILYSGNVGIGSSSPVAKLSVKGSGTGTGSAFQVSDSADSRKFVILDNGNVGIGVYDPIGGSDPAAKLHIMGPNTGVGMIRVGNNSLGTGDITGVDFTLNYSDHISSYVRQEHTGGWGTKLLFGTANDFNAPTTKLTVDGLGNVGIGTTSPYAKLSVTGLVAAESIFATSTTATSTFMGSVSIGTTSPFANGLFSVGTSSPNIYVDRNTGFVGVGTTSAFWNLTTYGREGAAMYVLSATSSIGIQISGDNPRLVFNDGRTGGKRFDLGGQVGPGTFGITDPSAGNASRFLVDYTGSIGFGTTSPYAKVSITSVTAASTTLALRPVSGQTGNILDIYNPSGVLTNVITSAGNVGIGTTSPAVTLSVAGNGYITGSLGVGKVASVPLDVQHSNISGSGWYNVANFVGGGNADNTGAILSLSPNTTFGGRLYGGRWSSADRGIRLVGVNSAGVEKSYLHVNAESDSIALYNSSNSGVFVNSSGNVGIGTTTPGNKLAVVGDATFGTLDGTGNGITVSPANKSILVNSETGLGVIGFTRQGSTNARIASQGSFQLDLYAGAFGANEVSQVRLDRNGGVGYVSILTGNNAAATERLRVDAAGNVGIGTTTPYAKLSVVGEVVAASFTATSTATSTIVGRMIIGTTTPTTTPAIAYVNIERPRESNPALRVIGGNPSQAALEVRSRDFGTPGAIAIFSDEYRTKGLTFRYSSTTDAFNIFGDYYGPTASPNLILGTFDYRNDQLVLATNGNVGIGTTSPFAKLSVRGDAYISGNLTATGTVSLTGAISLATTTVSVNSLLTGYIFKTENTSAVNRGVALGADGTAGLLQAYAPSLGVGGAGQTLRINPNGGDVNVGPSATPIALMENGTIRQPWSNNFLGTYFSGGTYRLGLTTQINNNNRVLYIDNQNADGIATNPGIQFRTGAGPTTVATILDNGNMGIGTTTPTNKLDIDVSSGDAIGVFSSGIRQGLFTFSSGSNGLFVQGATGKTVAFSANGISGTNAHMIISTTGNVGIGTTTPGAKLEIVGAAAAGILRLDGGDNQTGGNGHTQIAFGYGGTNQYSHFIRTRHNAGSNTNNAIDFYTSDGTATGVFPTNAVLGLTISGGNVGIGTTSPYTKLSVVGPVAAESFNATSSSATSTIAGILKVGTLASPSTEANAQVHIFSNVSGKAALIVQRGVSNQAADLIRLVDHDAIVKARFDAEGRLSISQIKGLGGAGGDLNLLQGTSNSTFNAQFHRLQLQTDTNNTVIFDGGAGFDTILQGYNPSGSTYTNVSLQPNGGNVGVGSTSPWAQFSVNPNGITGPSFAIGSTTGTSFVVTNAGKVGIGTTSPSVNLNIYGDSPSLFVEDSLGVDGNRVELSLRSTAASGAGWTIGTNKSFTGGTQESLYFFKSFSPNGGTKMVLNGIGNLGIGTNVPSSRLQIASSSVSTVATKASSYIQLGATENGLNSYRLLTFGYSPTADTYAPAYMGYQETANNGETSGDLVFGTRNVQTDTQPSERMRITAAGNLGIGTTSPFTKLSVVGNAYIGGNLTATGTLTVTGAVSAPYFSATDAAATSTFVGGMTVDGGTFVVDYSTSRVGLGGVSAPTTLLHLRSSTGSTLRIERPSGSWGLDINAADTNGDIFFDSLVSNGGTGNMIFRTNTTVSAAERMRIQGDGTIGIGTTSPFAKLAIGMSSTTPSFVVGTAGSSSPAFFVSSANGNGNVGIGTANPNAVLDVRGSSTGSNTFAFGYTSDGSISNQQRFQSDGSGASLRIITPSAGGIFLIPANGIAAKAAFTNSGACEANSAYCFTGGNLGIGTTSPQTKLEISSTVSGSGVDGPSFRITNGAHGASVGAGNIVGTLDFYSLDPQVTGLKAQISAIGDASSNWGPGGNSRSNLFLAGSDSGVQASGLTVNYAGNVGVGTTSPLYKLEIVGTANTQITRFGDGTRSLGISTYTPNSGGVLFQSGTENRLAFAGAAGSVNIGRTYASGFAGTTDGLLVEGNVGIGTTSPYAKLSVVGEVVGRNFTATSTTATSTFAGGLDVGNGSLRYDLSTGVTSIDNLEIGNTFFETDAGIIAWADMPVTAASANGVVNSYSASINGNPLLTVYSVSDGAGGITNASVGVGTTSPMTTLSVQGTTTAAVFNAYSLTGTSTLRGFLDVLGTGTNSTSTYSSNLWVKGNLRTTGNTYTGDLIFANNFAFTEGDLATTSVQKLILKSQQGNELFVIDENGHVGFGTTSDMYKVFVDGDIAATSFVNVSTRAAKKDISYMNDTEKESVLTSLRSLGVARYRYNEESEGSPLRLGLIAEEAPVEVLSAGGKGVDVYKLSTFILAGVQELAKKLDETTARITSVEARIAALEAFNQNIFASTSINYINPNASTTLDAFANWFVSLGASIEQGVVRFVSVVADTVTAKKLTVGDSSNLAASGITILDRVTGQPACVFVENGVMKTELGECGVVIVGPAPQGNDANTSGVSGDIESTGGDGNTNNNGGTTTPEMVPENPQPENGSTTPDVIVEGPQPESDPETTPEPGPAPEIVVGDTNPTP